MPSSNLKKNTVVCPVCLGDGIKNGFQCKNCNGMGVFVLRYNRFFYWGLKMGRSSIELDHVRKKIHQILVFFSYFFGLSGLASLSVWIFSVSNDLNTSDISDFYFWQERHSLILFFWFSVVVDMFLVYQASEKKRKRSRISLVSYDERGKVMKIPDNWKELKNFNTRFKIDVVKGFSDNAFAMIEDAFLLALKLGNKYVDPLHLFFACLQEKEVAAIFSRLNIDARQLIVKVKNQLSSLKQEKGGLLLSNELKEVLIGSFLEAHDFGEEKVEVKNLLVSCLDNSPILSEIMYGMDIDRDKIFNVVSWFVVNDEMVKNYNEYRKAARFKPSTNMDRAYTSVETKILNSFSYDLTLAAKYGKLEFCVGREEETTLIFQAFESGYNGVLLVGPDGVGKNMVVNGIAQLMVKEDVPRFFQDKRLLEVDVSRLVGGATPEQAEGRMLAIIDEVVHAGNVILYFKGVDKIVGITSGDEGSLDLAGVLSSAVERKAIYCFASVIDRNYLSYIEGRPLGNVMQKIDIKEPEDNRLIRMVESKISYFEAKYKVYFSYNAIEQVLKLARRYIYDKYFPKKAIDVLEMVAVKTSKTKGERSLVTKEDIAEVISSITGIPLTQVTESESKGLLNLEQRIHERMIGQEEAVKVISASLRRARTELREGKRPIANFLFLGPTGVGKTELAKSVSQVYFGSEEYMIRVDMSEYQHPDSVKKMIGDAGERGYLTEKVRKSPFSLVLLDEIEKAHPDILNLFLQVMDDGRLTDGGGRTVDFTSSIIVATSNAGAVFIQEEIKKNTPIEKIKEDLINNHLNTVMRPELVNRFDGVIVFKPLTIGDVVEIAKLMINKLEKMLDLKGIKLRITEAGLQKVANEGFDPKFGARPLRRAIQDLIENKIANKILTGELNRRDVVVIKDDLDVGVEKGQEL